MFIVQSLACFETPQQVADAVEEIYKIKIDRKQCHSYDPTKYAGRNLSKKLKDLFEQTRKEFRENIDDIAIANKAFRLRELQKMYEDSGKNKRTKQNLLKQAFQETDGRVTKQEITGPDGGPIQQETKSTHQFTPDELNGLSAQELSRLAINGKL